MGKNLKKKEQYPVQNKLEVLPKVRENVVVGICKRVGIFDHIKIT